MESKTDLFPERNKDDLLDEEKAQEIEIGTTYKLRPVVIIYELRGGKYLALAVTKRKNTESPSYFLAICNNEIKERHFLSLKNYPDKLKIRLIRLNSIHVFSFKREYSI